MKQMFIFREKEMMKSGTIKVDAIREFIKDYIDGKLEPFVLSEEIPEKPIENSIHVYVGKNIQERLVSSTKDTVLYVYAKECKVCMELLPQIEAFAKENSNIIVAKIDYSLNSLPPNFNAPHLPTFYYISQNIELETDVLEYSEDFEIQDLHKFVERNKLGIRTDL